MPAKTWEETFAALDLPEEKRRKIVRAVAFTKEHGVRCTGSSVRSAGCEWPPLQVLLFHGRPLSVNCPECANVNGAMIIGMGHGAFTTEGVLAFEKAGSGAKLRALADAILNSPVREVARGKYWTEAKELAWRKSLAEYVDG